MKCYLTWEQMERGLCAVLAVFPGLLAFAVLIGGTRRMPPPNYSAILEFSHGLTWPYAILWGVCAMMLCLGNERIRIGGLALTVVVSNLWAGLFLKAAVDNPTAAYTPCAAYCGYGVIVAMLLGLMVIHQRGRREDDRMV